MIPRDNATDVPIDVQVVVASDAVEEFQLWQGSDKVEAAPARRAVISKLGQYWLTLTPTTALQPDTEYQVRRRGEPYSWFRTGNELGPQTLETPTIRELYANGDTKDGFPAAACHSGEYIETLFARYNFTNTPIAYYELTFSASGVDGFTEGFVRSTARWFIARNGCWGLEPNTIVAYELVCAHVRTVAVNGVSSENSEMECVVASGKPESSGCAAGGGGETSLVFVLLGVLLLGWRPTFDRII